MKLIKVTILIFTLVFLSACLDAEKPKQCQCNNPNATTIELLNEIKETHGVPALAGLIWHKDDVLESGAVGVRLVEQTIPVTINDLWHVGSITKSMTATLAARLVEQGYIDWDSQIQDFITLDGLDIKTRLKHVTLTQLLSNQGGMLSDITNLNGWDQYFGDNSSITEQRLAMSVQIITSSDGTPGRFSYSNAGFVIAGTMLEQATGKSWEQLMITEVFEPLDMLDAGFGAPSSAEYESSNTTQPFGHLFSNGQLRSVDPQFIGSDNPKAMGPAGTVHLSIGSLLNYAKAHLNGQLGLSNYLSPDSFQHLHQVHSGGEYALGWFVDGESRSHEGTNTMWYAKLGWNANQSLIAIAVSNVGGDRGNESTDDVINHLLNRNSE